MKNERMADAIMVTGVGGGVGQSVVKALQGTPYRVVGVDAEELAAGLHAVPSAYKGCYANDPNFVDRILEICRHEDCKLVFAGHDVELMPLAANVERFHEEGILPVVSSLDVLHIADDKLATHSFLRAHGFPVPETCTLQDADRMGFPVILKPQRGGARSRKTYLARSPDELRTYQRLVDQENCVVQEYIEGDEYTCGSITFDGRCRGVIVMRRILRDGDTYKAFVERNEMVETAIRDVVQALRPFGPCNVQLRVRNGEPVVFEINARCSGTTGARALAGFNEPKMVADFLLEKREPKYTIKEISILRYWKELVVPNQRIEVLCKAGHIVGDGAEL